MSASGAGAESLLWVSKDLGGTLQDARLALEEYIEGGGNRRSLETCAERMHVVQGVLRMVEVYGAALLAEEMEKVAHYLLRGGSTIKNEEEALDALTRAMVQLPTYLERVSGGGRDIAMVLLPLLNDLRAVRGHPLLSEGTLLLLNLSPDKLRAGAVPGAEPGESDINIVRLARLLRPRFQLALLGWIKGEHKAANLGVLADVADQLQQAASTEPVHQLFWVIGGVLEALRDEGLEANVSLKRLLGQADRTIKAVIDKGERGIEAGFGDDLLNNLLYYVARSKSRGEKVTEICGRFELEDLLPSDELVQQARDSLSGPSVKLMQTVAAAIKEDMSKVKDVLDIYVRTGKVSAEELAAQIDLLRKISDTLGVLGLGDLRAAVQKELEALRQMGAGGERLQESDLERVAATLLQVEDTLDEKLIKLLMPVEGEATVTTPGDEEDEIEYRQVTEAVVGECILNLARVKEAIAQSLEQPGDGKTLDAVPQLLRGITAALLMLNRTRAVNVVARIEATISRDLGGGPGELPAAMLDRLADSIVSLEYYLETIQTGRADPWYMLDNAETCLSALEKLDIRPVPSEPEGAEPFKTVVFDGIPETTQTEDADTQTATQVVGEEIPGPIEEPVVEDVPSAEPVEEAPAAERVEVARGAVEIPELQAFTVSADGERVDPEILEIFIDEAKGEVESLATSLPRWIADPADRDALALGRRSFHTLKGSGRMVGAHAIGEFAWAIESLLNRIIDGTRTRTPAMTEFLESSLGYLPQLIEQLETGAEPSIPAGSFVLKAEAFARGEVPPGEIVVLPEAAPVAETEAVSEAVGAPEIAEIPVAEPMDPVLKEIFTKETSGHLAAIVDFVEQCGSLTPPYALTEALHRSCHTLSGSANMARVEPAVGIATPWNRYIRKLHDVGARLSEEGLEVCAQVVAVIQGIVDHLNDPGQGLPDTESLLARIERLEEDFDRQVAEAEAREAAIAAQEEEEEAPREEEAAGEFADWDPEIAAIFSDEATELLEAADACFAKWSQDPGDETAVGELRRHLHTLKGGARMAGVQSMGDLSHELETLLLKVGGGELQASEPVRDVFQQGIDQLHHMREAVSSGRVAPGELVLLEAIRSLGAGEAPVQPEAEMPPTVEAPAEEVMAGGAPEEFAEIAPEEAPAETEPEPAEPVPEEERPAAAEELVEPVQLPPSTVERVMPLEATGEIPAAQAAARTDRGEVARVDAELLDELLNGAGEISIFRSRLDQQINSIEFNLTELSQTVTRLKDQLRKLEIETEAQIIHRHQDEMGDGQEFDPLELDRYSLIQQLSRALAETASDVDSIRGLIEGLTQEAGTLLIQQGRVATTLQHGLMRTRMVPFERHAKRLGRVVRQVAAEVGKRVELELEGSGELDRQVLERMLGPLEHMLRNAVVHGIESPQVRQESGKPDTGQIRIRVRREGSEVVIEVVDDGAGLDIQSIKEKALARGLLESQQLRSDEQAIQLIFEPGFSTAEQLTQSAGRGVGMDVVASEVRKLGGSISVSTRQREGTAVTVRLPFTLAISQAMIVRVGNELYALPLPTVEGIARLPLQDLQQRLEEEAPAYEYGGQRYRFQYLAQFVGAPVSALPEEEPSVTVILVRAGEYSTALITDEMLGSREIVVKSVGPQLSSISGIAGATILGDGRIAIILDAATLLRTQVEPPSAVVPAGAEEGDRRTFVMVVDDSITVRRVTQRLLERNGMRVMTAKDGVDALALLQDHRPDVILLDIEMPRMDGYELAANVRNDERLATIPIVMITSRVGAKHRARAIELGVDDYLGKPYQETQLLDAIEPLARRGRVIHD